MTSATWHAAPAPALRRLIATAGPAGVVIGRDHSGAVAPVRFFRSEPTRVALVGGAWAARLLAFRCLAVGALVQVTTVTPGRWSGLAELSGAAGQVQIGLAGSPPPAVPEALGSMRPVLQINDIAAGGAGERATLPPWHGQLSVLPAITSHLATSVLLDADISILQRLTAEEAEICASTLRLPDDAAAKLQQMHDDMVVLAMAGTVRYLWLSTTAVEDELLGLPHRSPPDEPA